MNIYILPVSLPVHRAISALLLIIDELRERLDPLENSGFSFVRFLAEKTINQFATEAALLLPQLHTSWQSTIQELLQIVTQFQQQQSTASDANAAISMQHILQSADTAVEASACLRYLLKHSLPHLEKQQQEGCLKVILEALTPLLSLRTALPADAELREKVEEIIITLISIPREMQKKHPLLMLPVLSPFLAFCFHIISNSFDAQRQMVFEKLTAHCLLMIGQIFACKKYKIDTVAALLSPDNPNNMNQTVSKLVLLITTEFLVLSGPELTKWNNEPEEFIIDEERVEVSKLPASGNVLFHILSRCQDIVLPVVMKLLSGYSNANGDGDIGTNDNSNNNDNGAKSKYLVQESIYNVAGRCFEKAYDTIAKTPFEFSNWYTNILHKQITSSSTHPHYKYLRRRIVWLLGVGARRLSISDANKDTEVMRVLLSDLSQCLVGGDLVTRITAASAIRSAIKSPVFKKYKDVLVPSCLTPQLFNQVFSLVQEAKELETRTTLLKTIMPLIQSMDTHAPSIIPIVVEHFHTLWSIAEEQNVLRMPLLSTLASCVIALKTQSTQLYDVLLPVLEACTRSKGDVNYLLEASLNLWLSLVQNAPSLSQPLVGMFPRWLELAASDITDSDTKQRSGRRNRRRPKNATSSHAISSGLLKIAGGYMLLSPGDFSKMYGDKLNEFMLQLLSNRKNDQHDTACLNLLDLLVQVLPSSVLLETFGSVFDHLLMVMVRAEKVERDREERRKASSLASSEVLTQNGSSASIKVGVAKMGPRSDDQERDFRQAHNAFPVLARLLMQHYSGSMLFLSRISQRGGVDPSVALDMILELWFSRYALFTLPRRLLCAYGLTIAVLHPDAPVDITKKYAAKVVESCVKDQPVELKTDAPTIPESQYTEKERYQQIRLRDISRTTPVRSYLASAIQACVQKHGPTFQALLQEQVPNAFLRQLQ